MSQLLESFLGACPGAVSQGILWGIMALGVAVTYRILDYADLTVDCLPGQTLAQTTQMVLALLNGRR